MDIADTKIARRDDILARYRHLRAITIELHGEALSFVSRDAFLTQAKRLGLLVGKTIVAENESEDALLYDLLLHTSAPSRTRAIDRFARSRVGEIDADRAMMIEAMRASQFSICGVERRQERAGLVVTDLIHGKDIWLVDVGLETSLQPGRRLRLALLSSHRGLLHYGRRLLPRRSIFACDRLGNLRRNVQQDGGRVGQGPAFSRSLLPGRYLRRGTLPRRAPRGVTNFSATP